MGFRDDREAAWQRAQSLEQELAQKQREIDELRAGRRRPVVRALRWALAGVVCVVALVAALMAWSRAREAARQNAEAAEAIARDQAAALEARAREAARARGALAALEARAREDAEQLRAAESRARAAAAAHPPADITWSGSVDEAAGVDLAPGTPCTMEGAFASASSALSLHVQCGGRTLYSKAGGAPSVRLREGPAVGGAREYMLSYSDAMSDDGRAGVEVSTLQHRVTVSGTGAEAMRVVLFVRDVSAPRQGPALLAARTARAPAFAPTPGRAMRVRAARGHAPAAVGARCTVDVRPVWEFPENCRMAVRCDRAWVYGAREAGYLTCEVRDGRPVAALDERTTPEGGDPRVTWRDGRVVVSDFTEAGEWRLELAP